MKIYIFEFFLLFLPLFSEEKITSKHVCEGNRVAQEFIEQSIKSNELKLYIFSGNFFKQINEFNFDFIADRKANVDEARNELIVLTEKCLDLINNDKDIQPYLKHKPFTENDISISVEYIKNPKTNCSFSTIWLINGNVVYFPKEGVQRLFRETYSEAKRNTEQQQKSK